MVFPEVFHMLKNSQIKCLYGWWNFTLCLNTMRHDKSNPDEHHKNRLKWLQLLKCARLRSKLNISLFQNYALWENITWIFSKNILLQRGCLIYDTYLLLPISFIELCLCSYLAVLLIKRIGGKIMKSFYSQIKSIK